MKTMLGPRYDDQVAEENRFHPSMLLIYLKSLKVSNETKAEELNFFGKPPSHHVFPLFPQVKMGLLVDLTNTTRFYDRSDIEEEGIKYVKLQCKGYVQILWQTKWII